VRARSSAIMLSLSIFEMSIRGIVPTASCSPGDAIGGRTLTQPLLPIVLPSPR
jgi:hypothetical protein